MKRYQDYRDYNKEAKNLVKDLNSNDMYRLLEIVTNQLKSRQTDERIKELEAVRDVICKNPRLDSFRIDRIINGYRSEMAQDARAKDGNTQKWKKKV